MKALVDKINNVVLTRTENETDFGGPWGEMLKSGDAAFVDYPANEDPDDSDLVAGKMVLNAARKAARIAAATNYDGIVNRITTLAKLADPQVLTTNQIKQALSDLAKAVRFLAKSQLD